MEPEQLLSAAYPKSKNKATTRVLLSSAKWVLKITMWVVFIAWVVLMFIVPSEFGSDVYDAMVDSIDGTLYGTTGATFLIMGGPILLIAFLAIPYLIINSKEEEEQLREKKDKKIPRFRLKTFPVLVDGPFGVVSAAELIGILLFVVFVIWAVYAYTVVNIIMLPSYGEETAEEQRIIMVRMTAYIFGLTALSCLAFLFLPIARGSILLRLINIPFEHAVRYHIWLGNLIMFILTLHGLTYFAEWIMRGDFLTQLLEWRSDAGANFAGVICYSFFLVMWVTSLPPVRRRYFELFLYAHQLYILFIIFMALHIGQTYFSKAAAGIFLFMLDRFLRFWQSRRAVNVTSVTCFPCGTVQIVLSKPANLQYNALGFIFLQVQELSKLQWHPFSVASSPLDSKKHLSLLIKALGNWTGKLRGTISSLSGEEAQLELPFQPNSKITASVEGPYGHESPYYLMYENVILVAGGSGISAFIAILSDIIHRINEGKPCLTRNVLLVWAVKRSNELPLLYTIGVESVSPYLYDKLTLDIQTYVTRESEPMLEEGNGDSGVNSSIFPVSNGSSMSLLVGTGHIIWPGVYLVVSTVGFVIILGLLDAYYINPFGISKWWYLGILFLGCMAASVLVFGGLVVGLWHRWEKTSSTEESEVYDVAQHDEPAEQKDSCREYLARSSTVHYGCRPNLKEIFVVMSELWGHVDIGVIACGPQTLQSSVARECRSQNFGRKLSNPIFHFNSHSFEL
ncbi:ferric reduction oxidase 7, chloroplastic-like [Camellia sinensis]|uniref:ferric reduction oxidase 7, chloroplastic-like n=1 Tax=Camellia sinensis TaxID=4442 RepID=UPI00103599BC|nr:ferric reduction oxidase 7, chloroplastic-like [Camellia sinensis]